MWRFLKSYVKIDSSAHADTGFASEHHDRSALAALRSILLENVARSVKAKQLALKILEAGKCRWVGLYDVTQETVQAIAWTGDTAPAYPSFPKTKGLSGAAIATREPVVVQDVSKDPRYLTAFESTGSEAIFPVLSSDNLSVIGTIDIESNQCDAFSQEDQRLLKQIRDLITPFWTAEI